jgi:hypothetical protein
VSLEQALTAVGVVKVVDAVEHRGLAGAIGADDGQNLSLLSVETDSRQGLNPPEAQGNVMHAKVYAFSGHDILSAILPEELLYRSTAKDSAGWTQLAQSCPSEGSLPTVRCLSPNGCPEDRGAISGQRRPTEPQKDKSLSIYHECSNMSNRVI